MLGRIELLFEQRQQFLLHWFGQFRAEDGLAAVRADRDPRLGDRQAAVRALLPEDLQDARAAVALLLDGVGDQREALGFAAACSVRMQFTRTVGSKGMGISWTAG